MIVITHQKNFNYNALIQAIADKAIGSADDLVMQSNVLVEEATEALTALEKGLIKHDEGLTDALADTAFVAYGLLYMLGRYPRYASAMMDVPFDTISEVGLTERVYGLKQRVAQIHAHCAVTPTVDEGFEEWAVVVANEIEVVLADCFEIGALAGINVQEALGVVNRCNIAKFDLDRGTALETARKYYTMGIITRIVTSTVGGKTYYVNEVDGDVVVNDKLWPDGKWLKSINWIGPMYGAITYMEG